jgi:tetratricopeptide (TPR) repeat protein
VINVKPDFAGAYYQKGYCLLQIIRYEEAIASFDKAIELMEKYAWAYYQKGVCFIKLDKREEARECFHTARTIDPDEFMYVFYQFGLC